MPTSASDAAVVRAVIESRLMPELQAMVDIAREITGAALCTVAILDRGVFHFLIASGSAPFRLPQDDAMCKHSMGVHGLFEVPDTRRDKRMASLPHVDGRAAALRSYASTPIYAAGGVMVGRFCVLDVVPRTLTHQQARALSVLADSAGRRIQSCTSLRHRAAAD